MSNDHPIGNPEPEQQPQVQPRPAEESPREPSQPEILVEPGRRDYSEEPSSPREQT